ncbi:Transglut_core2 domain-containing protein [Candidatus Hydrogenisulfobacillus filiaventi]|uniref:Transglut_core2 domain-containing protein n=1 Tax=Candidatus Hydrogenisulfobacillus filiaventi TaxID=2707344 RepID=A0A6F8ZIT2_9FIRM|nr:transglutaminase-like domain-containing protein [Bacillota bacterium]CAB1129897.1 Transglut_core2 domain-containing protein [Candidatus Hydrogenisulfobacillus filiaventi]
MKPLTESQIKALIVLLGDEDIKTAAIARKTLLDARREAKPYLEEARESPDPHVRTRVYGILERLRLDELGKRFEEFAALPSAWLDLEEGAFLIAESAYPTINRDHYRAMLDDMANTFRARMESQNPGRGREVVEALNDYFFRELGFNGNQAEYYDPDNTYINQVLDRRLGIPISLATVYLLIARRLRLPVVGIGMPGHFLLQYNDNLFIDAFNKGQIMTRSECVQFLMNNGFGFHPAYLSPTPTRFMLVRTLTNLIQLYSQTDPDRADSLAGFRDLLTQSYTAKV